MHVDFLRLLGTTIIPRLWNATRTRKIIDRILVTGYFGTCTHGGLVTGPDSSTHGEGFGRSNAISFQGHEDLSVRVVDAQFACEIDSIFQVCVTRHLQHRAFQQPAHLLG